MSGYRFLNLNPRNKRTGDCVIRAAALALDLEWEQASDLLYNHARKIGCEMSCIGCYSTLFADMGLKEIPAGGNAVSDTAEEYPDSVLLIRIDGHLTCARYGTIYDIWDCRQERTDRAWIVK